MRFVLVAALILVGTGGAAPRAQDPARDTAGPGDDARRRPPADGRSG